MNTRAHTQVELTQLFRHPCGCTRREIRCRKPVEEEDVRQEFGPNQRKRAQIVPQLPAHATDCGTETRQADVLGMKSLERLHDCRDLGLCSRQPFALRGGERAGVWTDRLVYGNADP